MPRLRSRSLQPALAAAALLLLTTACLPSTTATGRPGPVRKVAVLGDSLTWGLFGTTPTVEAPLRERLAASGIALTLDGGPGDTVATPWPGHSPWVDQLQARVAADDPDVIVIQSVLFPGADDPAKQDEYRVALRRLLDIAQSRGAHVYLVNHHPPTNATEFRAAVIAQQLQAEVSAGRGIPTIPMDWWMARCDRAFVFDRFHLAANGERCWADAVTAAVNQLRNEVG